MANITIDRVFLTGVDEHTDLDRLLELTRKYPCVVWGVLISKGRAGKNNDKRYPSLDFIETLKHFIDKNNIRNQFGIHICGKKLINEFFVEAYNSETNWLENKYFNYFKYVQLNFNFSTNDLYQYALHHVHCRNQPCKPNHSKIIIQYNENNKNVGFYVKSYHGGIIKYFYDLIDFSGGTGTYKSPSVLLKDYYPYDHTDFGIAGGFGLDNIKDVITEIENENSYKGFTNEYYTVWIDMESKIRTDDILDLDICEQILKTHKEVGKYYDFLRYEKH